jgi:hypothetical protein
MILLCLVLGLSLSGFSEERSYRLADAQKVLQAIDKVQQESLLDSGGKLRLIELTEAELNAYIAFRIETEKEELMKELRLKLLEGNKIEGKIHIDLRGQDIPQFISPEMDFYFAADLLTNNGQTKVDIQQLFLEDEPIKPLILDLVIAISARLSKTEASSINDWYELPYGIKDIKTHQGKAVFYY